jgi:phage-related protein
MEKSRKIAVVFFRTASGADVVLYWLRGLDDHDRRVIGQDLMRLQFRWPIGMPLCRSLGDGLWELRSTLKGGRIARIVFCFTQDRLVAVHGFLKTTRTTPAADLAL